MTFLLHKYDTWQLNKSSLKKRLNVKHPSHFKNNLYLNETKH